MDDEQTAALAPILATPERRLYAALFKPGVTYQYTRFAILRLLGLVYFVAFVSAFIQLPALVGDDGLLPAKDYLHWLVRERGAALGFVRLPSLFWLIGTSDPALRVTCALGAAMSLGVLLGATNAVVQLALWMLYMSVAHVGQVFYGYGWEAQLLETGFLSIFLCPLGTFRPLPARGPPVVVLWLFRWLIVRIMLGAGLIKLRGDACWTDLTCLYWHYETQPVPSPVSWLLNQAPPWFHKLGVLYNHLVEVVAPFFAFAPARARHVAGVLFVSFQLILIVSGNLSFLNWLTIVPALACFDDSALGRFFPRRVRDRKLVPASRRHDLAARALAFVVALLSVMPIANLLSPSQAMNTTYEPLGLVSSYGAFGSVEKERYEVILEGTSELAPDDHTPWREYQLPCKPGDVTRRPCVISPYHYRLDWQLWFAAMSSYDEEPWVVHLVYQLLRGDRAPKTLLAVDPFPDAPPRWIRIQRYRYTMTHFGERGWWRREPAGEYLRPVTLDDPDLLEFVAKNGWSY
ncbi:MAG TPA: lipase maturation factor family protein [Polyangiaceae bacterium]